MARILHDDQGSGSSGEGELTVIHVDGQSQIQLPNADFMANGEILRDGQDLILQAADGTEVVVENYFSAMPSPTLTTPHGSLLTPELVQSFVKSAGALEYAANATENDASAVGIIKEVSGDATITRTDGSSEKVVLGMAVHQGDIVETSGKGAVNIVFVDESSFSISDNARLAIDEYVFDPATQGGETNVSILRGMFVFTSGLIGRDDPDDVKIETPVGSIGIRGTTIAGDIQPDGESKITVVEGAIVIANGTGEVTLSDQYQTVTLTGFESQIQMAGTLDTNQMKNSYGMLGTVNAGFFNTLNEAPAQDENAPADTTPATDTPADGDQTQTETPQPVIAQNVTDDPSANFEAVATNKSDVKATVLADTKIDTKVDVVTDTATKATASAHSDKIASIIANLKAAYLASLPVDLKLAMYVVDDGADQGASVGRAYTTYGHKDAKMSFLSVPVDKISGLALLELVRVGDGVYDIRLTAAGVSYMRENHIHQGLLGSIQIQVDVNGRTDVEGSRVVVGNTDGHVAVYADMHLNSLGDYPLDGQVHGGIAGGGGMGYSAAYTGNNHYAVFGNGRMAAGNGDINGDGKLDYVSGEPNNPVYSDGAVFVYSGDGSAPSYISSPPTSAEYLGTSVAMVDFNGDGKADVFASAPGHNSASGYVNVLWGSSSIPLTSANLGFSSFRNGETLNALGTDMAGLRDFNGDGFGDLAVTYQSGGAWHVDLIYGNKLGLSNSYSTLTVSNVEGGDIPIFDMGDMNGDGRSDMMIGETGGAGKLFIYYGQDGTPSTLTHDLSLHAGANYEFVGAGSVGDFNGDGFDDIFAATRNTTGTGDSVDGYIIYGSSSLTGILTLTPEWASLNSSKVFHMTLNLSDAGATNFSDFGLLATAIGDQNGDGLDDVLLSSDDFNGGNGGYYVVYGKLEASDIAGTNPRVHASDIGGSTSNITASSNFDGLVGNSSVNHLSDGGYGQVSFNGGAGDDTLIMNSLANSLDGGAGFDKLEIFSNMGLIDLTTVSEFSGIEKISFMAGSGNTLKIGLDDIFGLLQSSSEEIDAGFGIRKTLYITNEDTGTKSLQIDDPANHTYAGGIGLTNTNYTYTDTDGNGQTYAVYTYGSGYQLLIDNDSSPAAVGVA